MKKYISACLLVVALFLAVSPLETAAQEAAQPERINARILPLLWYSALSIDGGDTITIYAGIQNNSGIDFTGTAAFSVDGKNIAEVPFTSKNDSLRDISARWVADPGPHTVQATITASLPSGKTLVAYESDKSNITVSQKAAKEAVTTNVLDTASAIVSKTDALAGALADKIESFKKPAEVAQGAVEGAETTAGKSNGDSNTQAEEKGSVLNASIGPTPESGATPLAAEAHSAFNIALGGLAFLVRHWPWVLGILLVIFLILKIKR
jgi:hypothetical protein